jgi:hypothetical protein
VANHWRWHPRPVFQSYAAYTPALDRLNADFIESQRAADFVLLDFTAANGRHPILDTPLSFRALFDRYDLRLSQGGYLVLQHRPASRCGAPVAVSSAVARWDQEVTVPQASGILLMAAHVQPGIWGAAINLLFRPAPVFMYTRFASGSVVGWRTVPRNLASSFPIVPFPRNIVEASTFFTPNLTSDPIDRVVTVSFHSDRTSQFQSNIQIEWSRLSDCAK